MNLQKNKEEIYQSVTSLLKEVGRSEDSVQIIAVTKYVDISTTKALIETGVTHIGENRVDKFLEKYTALKDESLTWHLIGSLQRRKVKDIINYVDYFHALDNLTLAAEIEKRATHVIKCFLQVNISGETSKHGFRLSEIDSVIEELSTYQQIELVGLMTMAPLGASEDELEEIFTKAEQLRREIYNKKIENMPMTELSMGMSGDYPQAIAKGATFVRIGSAFFK